ncbi:hypothetical protein LSTR_LSTR008379 [Laodelphax striatellus]|uniref:Programmed cell death protein 2 C-terminal domain-containing protein n=1 Tax=Laodelphax striatellus TaxID=195883 RepID=A0A482XSV4_LAOST|nr:hypothetical protein LSTR_LSTR008379 [Laodelphax striatellus]
MNRITGKLIFLTNRYYSVQKTEKLTKLVEENGVRKIILANPKTRNALSVNMMEDIIDDLSLNWHDNSLRCIVISGEGPVFSSGHNLKELALTGKKNEMAEKKRVFSICSKLMKLIIEAPVPVIACVNGPAVAAGCQLVAQCDLALASQKSTFATPGSHFGIFCSTPGIPLARAVPRKVAAYMLFTGKPITAEEAARHGLISKAVADDKLDEAITDKYKSQVDFTCNKIGGKPDWPSGENRQNPTCRLCSLSLPLILQIYAPIDNSFHRTIYIFACINPNCWNQNGSHVPCGTSGRTEVVVPTVNTTDWCDGADNWEDEENGNTIELVSNHPSSDEEHDISTAMADLNVNERNANRGGLSGAQGGGGGGGAMGRLLSPTATAEIEGGDESEVVTIDTPPSAQVNVISLFEQAAPVPQVPSSSLFFAPYFISVGEEERCTSNSPTNSEHVKELLQGFHQSWQGVEEQTGGNGGAPADVCGGEKYERSIPAHGDKMFHSFLCRIQSNPGQLLRYCRDGGSPLFLYPPLDVPVRCRYCQGELVFELQILPTIISRLRLMTSATGVDQGEHLEFGSVFLFSCRRSCWTLGDSFREEQLYIQIEKI